MPLRKSFMSVTRTVLGENFQVELVSCTSLQMETMSPWPVEGL
jgi:hypothetical protein